MTLAALQAGKNVLVDGSLRDSEWYSWYFGRLREDFPSVRQAIIHVTAPREAVFSRAAVSFILFTMDELEIASSSRFKIVNCTVESHFDRTNCADRGLRSRVGTSS